jgi:integrase
MLTDIACKTAKPQSKNYKMRDGRGLYLFVMKAGGKSWRYDYKVKRPDESYKNGTYVFGSYPDLSLAEARQSHNEARQLVSQGIDPHEHKKDQERTDRQSRALTFADVAQEWLAKRKGEIKAKTHIDIVKRLERDVLPVIGGISMVKLNSIDILDMLKKIEARGAYEMANRARQTCSQVLMYAVAIGKADRDFTVDIKGALVKKKTKHQPALAPHEIAEFLTALERNEARLYPQTRYAIEMLMLTFVRPIELASAEWAEFDLKDKLWVIPAEKMKMEFDHVVPLSDRVLKILHDLRLMNGSKKYVFGNVQDPKKHMSRDTLSKAVRSLGFQGRHSAHGFRAMARTTIREKLNWDKEVIERQLSHAPSGSLGRAYDRTQFIDQRKVMMQEWAEYLDTIGHDRTVIVGKFVA